MIVRLHSVSEDDSIWQISLDRASGPVALDYIDARREHRSFASFSEGYYDAEADGNGWTLLGRVADAA